MIKETKENEEKKGNVKTLPLILQTFDMMTPNSRLAEVRPDILLPAGMNVSSCSRLKWPNSQVQTL